MNRLLSQHRWHDRVVARRIAAVAASRRVFAAGTGMDIVASAPLHIGTSVCLRRASAPEARE